MSASRRLAAIVPALLLFAALSLPFLEYLTDDTFIFLRFADNLAGGHGFAFNPDEPVYGFTSPLWVLLLAALRSLGLPLLPAAKMLAFLFAEAAIIGFALLARRRLPGTVSALATCAFAANAWLVRWTGAAMETSLAAALIIWGLERQAAEADDDSRPPLAALFFALAALARPEAALLVAFALVADLAGGARARLRAFAGAGVAALVLVPWLAYARLTFGTFVPVTAEAKGRLDPAMLDIDPLLDVARSVGVTSGLEVILIGMGAVAWVASKRARADDPPASLLFRRHGVALLWVAALPLLYVVTGFDVLSRYALPLIPVVVLYGFASLSRLTPVHSRRNAVALLAAILVQNALVLAFIVYPHTHRFSRGVEGCLAELGRWAAANTAPGTTVAIADIGAFGYYSGRRVLDLAGLVSPELLPIVNEHPIDEIAARLLFARTSRPEYLVDRYPEPERLAGAQGGTFEPISWCRIEGLGVRSPQPVTYTLYRLHWDRYDAQADHAERGR